MLQMKYWEFWEVILFVSKETIAINFFLLFYNVPKTVSKYPRDLLLLERMKCDRARFHSLWLIIYLIIIFQYVTKIQIYS